MKILSVIGARPQFIKAAVFRKFCEQNNIQETLINTANIMIQKCHQKYLMTWE